MTIRDFHMRTGMLPAQADRMSALLRKAHPQEGCGVVLHDGTFIPLDNCSPTPEAAFSISWRDMNAHKGRIAFIVHSHPDGSPPSASDRQRQAVLGIPYIVVAFHGDDRPPEYHVLGSD